MSDHVHITLTLSEEDALFGRGTVSAQPSLGPIDDVQINLRARPGQYAVSVSRLRGQAADAEAQRGDTIRQDTISSVRPCKACGAALVFIRMVPSGKLNPCNAEPITLINEHGEVVKGYQSHFITCPEAARFRKKTARRK